MALRAMTFNVYGWSAANSLEYVAEAIRESRADVVGVQELESDDVRRLAVELGWDSDSRASVLSRHALSHAPGSWVIVGTDLGDVLCTSLHLPHKLYGPDRLRRRVSPSTVATDERRVRVPALDVRLDAVESLPQPKLVLADLNSPSHLDDARVLWPVTSRLAARGYADAYRAARPDGARDAGHTWWASRDDSDGFGCTRVAPCARAEPSARIDFVFARGLLVLDAHVLGEPDSPADHALPRWRSDHRAVVATLVQAPHHPGV